MSEIEKLQSVLAKAKEKEKELADRVEELEDFIENGSLPLHWVDGEGKIIWANKAELESLGYTKEEYIGKSITDFHANPDTINDILTRLTNKETLRNYEATLKHKNGSVRHVLINSNVLFKNDKFKHTRCFTRDITEIKELERKKDEFIGAASHELKTPLTSIQAYVELLERTIKQGDIETANAYIKKTRNTINRMNTLIMDMLDLSKIHEGKLACTFKVFNPMKLINNSVESIKHIVSHEIILKGKITQSILGDEHRLDQVLTNLLTNSVKYSPESGKVMVVLEEDNNEIIVEVKDLGIGIPKEKQKHIFDRFYRAEDQIKYQGLGIGLFIASEIIKQHKGKLWVESEPNKGSSFFFSIPVVKN